MPQLEVNGLTAGYRRGAAIIHDVSLEIATAQVGCIIGPNGAGKSTLVKSMLGLCTVERGTVKLDQRDVTGLRPSKLAAAGLAYVPQVNNVFPSLTVRENLEMGGWLRRREVPERIAEIVELFPDLGDALSRKAGQLSGGQRNMLALARALMMRPQFVLLDEPTAGLSPIYVDRVWDQVARVAAAGVGVLIVEQNARRALEAADRGWVLVAGKVALGGAADEILGSEEIVDLYLGGEGRVSRGEHVNNTTPVEVISNGGR